MVLIPSSRVFGQNDGKVIPAKSIVLIPSSRVFGQNIPYQPLIYYHDDVLIPSSRVFGQNFAGVNRQSGIAGLNPLKSGLRSELNPTITWRIRMGLNPLKSGLRSEPNLLAHFPYFPVLIPSSRVFGQNDMIKEKGKYYSRLNPLKSGLRSEQPRRPRRGT